MAMLIRSSIKKIPDKRYLEMVGRSALNVIKKRNAEVGLVFVGEKRMKYLNRKYRGRNNVTDVLSFGNDNGEEDIFICPIKTRENLGDILICMSRARQQAAEKGHSVKREVAILLIHGILHLAGYDHETDEDEIRMRGKENQIIAKL